MYNRYKFRNEELACFLIHEFKFELHWPHTTKTLTWNWNWNDRRINLLYYKYYMRTWEKYVKNIQYIPFYKTLGLEQLIHRLKQMYWLLQNYFHILSSSQPLGPSTSRVSRRLTKHNSQCMIGATVWVTMAAEAKGKGCLWCLRLGNPGLVSNWLTDNISSFFSTSPSVFSSFSLTLIFCVSASPLWLNE